MAGNTVAIRAEFDCRESGLTSEMRQDALDEICRELVSRFLPEDFDSDLAVVQAHSSGVVAVFWTDKEVEPFLGDLRFWTTVANRDVERVVGGSMIGFMFAKKPGLYVAEMVESMGAKS